jgi:hypothetical protein
MFNWSPQQSYETKDITCIFYTINFTLINILFNAFANVRTLHVIFHNFFLEQPAGALPFQLEGGKNKLYKSGHVSIIVVTCQNHSKTKTKKSNRAQPG